MPAARRRRRELVEERQVGPPALERSQSTSVRARLATARPVRRAARAMLLGCTRHGNLGPRTRITVMPSASRLARASATASLPRTHAPVFSGGARAPHAATRGVRASARRGDDLPLARRLRDRLGVVRVRRRRRRAYAGDYRGAFVVDVGAHKGYYGAYALAHGARWVVSYEPETANFALLERAASDVRERGGALADETLPRSVPSRARPSCT